MSGSKSRDKGARAERELASLLAGWLDDDTIRRNANQAADGGYDLLGESLRHFAIESKHQERRNMTAWLRQTEEQATEVGLRPLLAVREPHSASQWHFYVPMSIDQLTQYIRFVNCATDGYVTERKDNADS